MAETTGDEAHAQVKFVTHLKRYTLQETPFSLPTSAGCLELNSLLTGLLFGEDVKAKEALKFDFLVNGELLRTTLTELIDVKQLSTESVIEIEYTLKEDVPQKCQSLLHNDWISSIDVGDNSLILTGSFDNTIGLWNMDGQCLVVLEGHLMAVKSVSWAANSDSEKSTFLSASQDQTVLMWEIEKGKAAEPERVHSCRGHAGSVNCLAVNDNVNKFASGSWDKMIKIWDSKIDHAANDEADDDDGESVKRKKGDKKSGKTISTRTPLMTFSGHKEPVSSLLWSDENVIISAGWDHSIRLWNVATALNTRTLNSNKVILDISYSEKNKLLCSGSVDNYIRLYDTRLEEGEILKTSLSSHTGWVSSVSWSPDNENQLVSGSYDLTVRLWDIRKKDLPIAELGEHEDKVMCVCWSEGNTIFSGGADCQVHMYERKVNSPVNAEE